MGGRVLTPEWITLLLLMTPVEGGGKRVDVLSHTLPESVKAGDRVRLNCTIEPHDGDEPGQAPSHPGVIDDRAFYPS